MLSTVGLTGSRLFVRQPVAIQVYKEPTCGCCSQWVEHLNKAGFAPTVEVSADIAAITTKYRVPQKARSCHSALVGGDVIEGRGRTMDVDITTQIEVAAPAASVAAFASEPDNAPRWYVNIKHVEWQTPRPLAIGSRFAFVAEFLGRRLEYVYEVVEFIPGARLVMRTSDGPFPMETTYEWTSTDSGTRMTLRNRGTPSGFSRLVAPFLSAAMRRANRKDLAFLKTLLEAT